MIDEIEKLLREIIAIESVNPPGNERVLAEYLYEKAIKAGMEAQIQPICDDRANLILHVSGNGNNKKSLLLNGHLDVVPAAGSWNSPPFSLDKRDGRFYGRGTCDMKGAICCMFTAAANIIRQKFPLKGDLWLAFVADEECNDTGTYRFLEDPPQVDCCVIGEPTGLDICYAHRGVFRPRVIIKGKSAHAARPEEGINAVEKMAEFTIEIVKLADSLKKQPYDPLRPTVAVTTLHGGDKHNIIPDRCEAVLDYRLSPEDTEQAVIKTLSRILNCLSDNRTLYDWEIEKVVTVDAGYLPTDSNIVRKLAGIYKRALAREPVLRPFTACGEQSIFLKAGIPAVYCGPGNCAQAHIVDEYCEIDQIKEAEVLYENFIKEFLG